MNGNRLFCTNDFADLSCLPQRPENTTSAHNDVVNLSAQFFDLFSVMVFSLGCIDKDKLEIVM
jgi:hypothetical protein